MRHLFTASALLCVGLAAAIPFRRPSTDPSAAPAPIASGPLGDQLPEDVALNVSQWIDRSEGEPAIGWQSQPMSFEREVHSLELPEMPAEFTFDEEDKAVPQPILNRFGAAAVNHSEQNSRPRVAEPIGPAANAIVDTQSQPGRLQPGLLQPPPFTNESFESIEPLPTFTQVRKPELNVQGVSTSPLPVPEVQPPAVAPERHYIREPD